MPLRDRDDARGQPQPTLRRGSIRRQIAVAEGQPSASRSPVTQPPAPVATNLEQLKRPRDRRGRRLHGNRDDGIAVGLVRVVHDGQAKRQVGAARDHGCDKRRARIVRIGQRHGGPPVCAHEYDRYSADGVAVRTIERYDIAAMPPSDRPRFRDGLNAENDRKRRSPKHDLHGAVAAPSSVVRLERDSINPAHDIHLHVDFGRPADRFDATWSFVARIVHVSADRHHAQLHRHRDRSRLVLRNRSDLLRGPPTAALPRASTSPAGAMHERQPIMHRVRDDRQNSRRISSPLRQRSQIPASSMPRRPAAGCNTAISVRRPSSIRRTRRPAPAAAPRKRLFERRGSFRCVSAFALNMLYFVDSFLRPVRRQPPAHRRALEVAERVRAQHQHRLGRRHVVRSDHSPRIRLADHVHEQQCQRSRTDVDATAHQRFVIASTAAMSSALSRHDAAATFASTCAADVAPAMTLEITGFVSSQPNARSSRLCSRCVANSVSSSTTVKLRSFSARSARRRPLRGACLAAAVRCGGICRSACRCASGKNGNMPRPKRSQLPSTSASMPRSSRL